MYRPLLPLQLQAMRNHGQTSSSLCLTPPTPSVASRRMTETCSKILPHAIYSCFCREHTLAGGKALYQSLTMCDLLH